MLMTPGLTATNMPRGLKLFGMSDSPAKAARCALRDLGHSKQTPGTPTADLAEQSLKAAMFLTPTDVWRWLMSGVFQYHSTYF
jgi:hypothetical protein